MLDVAAHLSQDKAFKQFVPMAMIQRMQKTPAEIGTDGLSGTAVEINCVSWFVARWGGVRFTVTNRQVPLVLPDRNDQEARLVVLLS